MQLLFENINRVLAQWNPIGVSDEIVEDEYKGYIPLILKFSKSKQKLIRCLENILINKMGVGYDPTNKEHLKDLESVCDKLIKASTISN